MGVFARAVRSLPAIAALMIVVMVAWSSLERRARGEETPVEPSAPRGMIAFFTGGACPPGWEPAAEVEGRLIVGVTDPSQAGVGVGSALGDREDRAHHHTVTSSAKLSSKDVIAFDGSNDDGAAAGTYSVSGAASAHASGHSFIQVQACVRP